MVSVARSDAIALIRHDYTPGFLNMMESGFVKLWCGKCGSSLETTYSPPQDLHGFDSILMCLDIASANCSVAYFSAKYAHPP